MANLVQPSAKEAFMSGDLDLSTGDIKFLLMDTGVYTYSAGHEFEDDLSGIIAESPALTTVTVTGGVFNSDNTVFTSVSGATVESLWLFKDTGTPGTSHLIAYWDSATGLVLTPDGNNVNLSKGGSSWFSL
jgi:hypothetical protein